MKIVKSVLALATVALLTSTAAQAVPLKVVKVGAPAINCVFNATCTITVTDTVSKFTWPSIIAAPTASASFQSRTANGVASAVAVVPGANLHVYMYRVTALTGGSTDCVSGLVMDVGPVASLDYNNSGKPSQIFVVTMGGLGTVGIQSADQVGNTITFKFTQAICNTVAQGSYFFGFAAKTLPETVKATALVFGAPGASQATTEARVPTH